MHAKNCDRAVADRGERRADAGDRFQRSGRLVRRDPQDGGRSRLAIIAGGAHRKAAPADTASASWAAIKAGLKESAARQRDSLVL
ncbi:hypothetical protein [Mesorhizobium sp. B2-4-15]|uniref:hypothetical protein n=1 Tax=Mesorhizobium sp. B2-4-15 TaxID=2589934 RepID=UPI001FEF329A|nr:hypothetical protein [Mesorhizobium sp. B2-4-15]